MSRDGREHLYPQWEGHRASRHAGAALYISRAASASSTEEVHARAAQRARPLRKSLSLSRRQLQRSKANTVQCHATVGSTSTLNAGATEHPACSLPRTQRGGGMSWYSGQTSPYRRRHSHRRITHPLSSGTIITILFEQLRRPSLDCGGFSPCLGRQNTRHS